MTVLEGTQTPTRDAAPGAAVLLAVDRLLTAGALYPMGHSRFGAAVAEYRRAASDAAGARAVVLETDGTGLNVLGADLDSGCRGRERLLGLMEKLGIAQIRIEADAPEGALHTLATQLLRQRREADEDGHLKQAAFADLPTSVAVVPRTFRRRWSDGIDTSLLPLLEALLAEVAAACPDEHSADTARRTVERLFHAFLAGDQDGDAALCTPEDRALFATVLRDDPRGVGNALRRLATAEGGLASLDELLDDSHEALASAGAHQALHLLLGAMSGSDKAREQEPVAPELRRVDDDAAFRVPLAELQTTLDEIAAEAGGAPTPTPGDLREDASICLALLALAPAPGVARQALAGLYHAVRKARTAADREFLRETAMSLLDTADLELLDQVLPRLAGPFRERGVDDVADFWVSLAAGDAERKALVWPHAVVELLRSEPESDMRGLAVLQSLATELSPGRMLHESARFASLPGFVEGTFNRSLFHRPRALLNPLYAALLRTPLGRTFGNWLYEGWLRLSADTVGGLTARVAGPYQASLRELYEAVLAHGQNGEDQTPPRALLDAARLVVDGMDGEARRQDWVPTAILVLGRWSPAASRRLCERIAGERRLLVMKAWPADCRAAARTALRQRAAKGDRHGR